MRDNPNLKIPPPLERYAMKPSASTYLNAFRLYKDSMGNAGWMPTVYIHEETANLVAEDKKEEWTSYKVNAVKVRVLNENEGAVHNDLVAIERTTPAEIHRARALRKLTKAEKEALNL